eukprot:5830199-Prymnesium_polylepis.1
MELRFCMVKLDVSMLTAPPEPSELQPTIELPFARVPIEPSVRRIAPPCEPAVALTIRVLSVIVRELPLVRYAKPPNSPAATSLIRLPATVHLLPRSRYATPPIHPALVRRINEPGAKVTLLPPEA